MPFLDDTGPRDEPRGPVWAAFATVASQVERLVAANVVWAVQLAPGLVALGFPELPGWLRIVLALYSATVLPPATAVLYGLAAEACEGQHVDAGLARELLRSYVRRSLLVLAPLYGTFGVLVWLLVLAMAAGVPALVTALTAAALLWSVVATYFGPLFADRPSLSALGLARASVRLVWRRPEQALVTWLVVVLAALAGVVSVGGLVLIVPMLIAILQTHRYARLR
ncbi:hypothetical protein [Flindersiella endophytica]